MAEYFDYTKHKRRPPGEPLPLIPGVKNEKEFAAERGITKGARRQYLDARAQLAGYKNFRQWEESRKATGTQLPKKGYTRRKPDEHYVTGNLYVFDFRKVKQTIEWVNGKEVRTETYTIPRSREDRLFDEINRLIPSFDDNKYIQFHFAANNYERTNTDIPIDEWDFSSTTLIDMSAFKEKDFVQSGHNIMTWFYRFQNVRPYTFPTETENFPKQFSKRMKGKTIYGFREIHITVWDKEEDNHRHREDKEK